MITSEQLALRRKGIGASDAATILGLNPWRTRFQLWLEKTGRLEAEESKPLSKSYWGNVLEEAVATGYQDATGEQLIEVPETLYHPEHDWMFCHLDRKVADKDKVIECKTAGIDAKYQWGVSGSDHAPEMYILQVQHQLAVTGYQEGVIAVLIAGNDFRYYPIQRDQALIDYLIEAESNFIHFVRDDMPPPMECRTDVELFCKAELEQSVDATPEILANVLELKEIKAAQRELAKLADRAEDTIALFLLNATHLVHDNKPLLTWKPNKHGNRTFRISR